MLDFGEAVRRFYGNYASAEGRAQRSAYWWVQLYVIIFILANVLPNIMLSIRRFHDLNQTGWLFLLFVVVGQIPVIGILSGLANLIWFIMPGTNGPNKYGPDPLGMNTDVFG